MPPDEPDKDDAMGTAGDAGGAAAAAATADDDAGPLTEESLYPKGGEAGTDKGGKPAKKPPEDEGGGEPEGGKPTAKDRTAEWDRERQARDQAHANERRAMMDQLRTSQETNQKLLERLEAATKPKAGTEADEDLKELDDALAAQARIAEALTEDSDPAELVKAQRQAVLANQAVAKALKKVHTSSGASPQLEELRKHIAETQAQLEELRADNEDEAGARANDQRKGRFEEHLAALDKKFGPQLRNPAKALAVKRLVTAGYNGLPPDDPRANPPPEDVEVLAMELAYRDARDELAARKPKPGGHLPAADTGAGGGAAGGGKPKGRMTNKQYLRTLRGR